MPISATNYDGSTNYSVAEMGDLANDNILDNADFKSGIINQKGQTSYQGGTGHIGVYGIDRWMIVSANPSTAKLTVNAKSITLQNTHTSQDMYFVQKIYNSLETGSYCYFVKVKSVTGEVYAYVNFNDKTRLEVGDNVATKNGAFTEFSFQLKPNSSVEIEFAKLEKGSIFTGMPPWKEGIELAKCINAFRYEANNYFPIWSIEGAKATVCVNHNGMRKIPTVTVNGGFGQGADRYSAQFSSFKVLQNKLNVTLLEVTFNKNLKGTLVNLNVSIDSNDY